MSENRIEINSGFQGKTYVWVKSGEPVEVSMTCGGKPFKGTKKCVDCLGETNNGIDCINDLLVNEIVKEVVEDDKMILDKCVVCECTTEVDTETFMCEGCADNIFGNNEEENKGMKFIDAIQKYDKITKSGHKVFYMHKVSQEVFEYNTETKIGKSITADIRLLTSDGWYEYKEDKLILPKRFDYPGVTFYTISTINNIYTEVDQHAGIDTKRFDAYNYFFDRDLAQYVADKQLLYRIQLVLYAYNKDRMDDDTILKLTNEYIDTYYKEVLDRVLDYQDKM